MLHEQETFDDPHLNGLLPALVPSRRGFIAASASVGFALAAGPLNAQSAIRTPADGLDVADLTVPVTGGQMPAYRAAPAKAGLDPIRALLNRRRYIRNLVRDVETALAAKSTV